MNESELQFGLKTSVINDINAVFSQFPEIEQVIIYGSRAKGNYRNGSDIDLTFIGSALSHALLNKISWALDELYLPYKFDLSIFTQINNPELVAHIETFGQVFYCKDSRK